MHMLMYLKGRRNYILHCESSSTRLYTRESWQSKSTGATPICSFTPKELAALAGFTAYWENGDKERATMGQALPNVEYDW